jgi:hypothetical protein
MHQTEDDQNERGGDQCELSHHLACAAAATVD